MVKWRNINEEQPDNDEDCLTVMKHGVISGTYDAVNKSFRGYYWHDMEWSSTRWVPVSEVLD